MRSQLQEEVSAIGDHESDEAFPNDSGKGRKAIQLPTIVASPSIRLQDSDGIVDAAQLSDIPLSPAALIPRSLSPKRGGTGGSLSRRHDATVTAPSRVGRWQELKPLIYVFFVTIAATLGTGILGLPVSLSKSGFLPFGILFSATLLVQILAVMFMVELLQRSDEKAGYMQLGKDFQSPEASAKENPKMAPEQSKPRANTSAGHLQQGLPKLLRFFASPHHGRQQDAAQSVGGQVHGLAEGPSLHKISALYLSPAAASIFDFAVILHFLSVLISYALAGSQSIGHLLGINHDIVIIPFVMFFSTVLVCCYEKASTAISYFTMIKVALLLVLVAGSGYVASQIVLVTETSWIAAGEPFLMGTVALGGVVNVMPVLYGSVGHKNLRGFRAAICLGIVTCWMLNLMWAYYVLHIVPQKAEVLKDKSKATPSSPSVSSKGVLTLEQASMRGDISTVPVLNIIERDFPSLRWMSAIVDVFITVSISVSYLTMGAGMKHMLDGMIRSIVSSRSAWKSKVDKIIKMLKRCFKEETSILQTIFYSATCATILAVGLANPSGFLMVLEIFTSLALNLESGFFVAIIFAISRHDSKKIKLSLSDGVARCWVIVMLFFLLAMLYDFVFALSQ